jgi:hypothetical protein
VSVVLIPLQQANYDSERVSHWDFKASDAWMIPYECESCLVFHTEKFWAEKLGGSENVRKRVERLAKEVDNS